MIWFQLANGHSTGNPNCSGKRALPVVRPGPIGCLRRLSETAVEIVRASVEISTFNAGIFGGSQKNQRIIPHEFSYIE
jgi:hypothetical protein